uniref:Uncharacterized protein n=1 Tax=Castor canadensis TaxID=51338 RepID=A0A8C0XDX7_CASCN
MTSSLDIFLISRLQHRGRSCNSLVFPTDWKNKHMAQSLLSPGTCLRCVSRVCGADTHVPYKLPYKMEVLSHKIVKHLPRVTKALKKTLL